mgnify:FL=1
MLNEILNKFSEGELAEIIGGNYISDYQTMTDALIEKPALANAVYILSGFEIVAEKTNRARLIERMSPEQVDKILSQLLDNLKSSEKINSLTDKYDLLETVATNYPHEFGTLLGFGDAISLAAESAMSIEGIRRCVPDYPLYPYQQKIVKKASQLIASETTNRCLIHLPTGAGKTRTAMNIACEHLRENENALVLWLADTSELCTQAVDEFDKAWTSLGNQEIKIYSYFSDTNISLGGIDQGFLVAGLQKLNSAKKSDLPILYNKLQDFVTLIIFDEAHKAIAPTYSQTIGDMLQTENKTSAFLLGLSATPGRKIISSHEADAEDRELSEFFNSNKITMKISGYESPIKYLVDEGYLAKATFHTISYDGGRIVYANEFSSKKHDAEIKRALTDDQNRNLKLLETIRNEYHKGRSIIVFACSVDHSRNLAAFLSFEGVKAYSLDSKYDSTETRRFKIAEYSKGNVKVLINYNILTAGFDAPITSVAIVARPTDSLVQYSQMVGRAMRGKKSKGNETCDIYTVRDDIPAFTSVLEAFSHWDEMWEEV